MSTSTGLTRRGLLLAGLAPSGHGAPRISAEAKSVSARTGVVAAEPPDAVRAGAKLFEQGGNAFDAIAAAAIAACMLEPHSVDVGGYVCAGVLREAKTGRIWSLDSNSVAPAAAHERMYRTGPAGASRGLNENEYGCSVGDDANVFGPLAVGVPGVMAGIGTLWERFGRARWPAIVEPSLTLLDRGFPFGPAAGAVKTLEARIRRWESSVRHLMPEGRVPAPSDVWRRRDMEKTLRRVSGEGWRDFYKGELGRRIADYVQSAGGLLTRDDMARFEPRLTEPYRITYRGATVCSAILANGGVSVLEFLNMLECFDRPERDDPAHWHRVIEILKLTWRDRLRHLGDPDFTPVPLARLLSKDYAGGRVETLRAFPAHVDTIRARPAGESPGTINLSAADGEGNVIAMTISHGGSFGSCMTVPGTGITLGHGMCRFDPRPGRPNSVAARKRPLNNTCPTLIELPGRWVACGMRGGRRIVSVVSLLCHRVIDWDEPVAEAVNTPRVHVEEQEPAQVTPSLPAAVTARLREMGHSLNPAPAVGGHCNGVESLKSGGVRGGGNVWAAGVD